MAQHHGAGQALPQRIDQRLRLNTQISGIHGQTGRDRTRRPRRNEDQRQRPMRQTHGSRQRQQRGNAGCRRIQRGGRQFQPRVIELAAIKQREAGHGAQPRKHRLALAQLHPALLARQIERQPCDILPPEAQPVGRELQVQINPPSARKG